VRFAAEHPSHFEIMFRPDLCHGDDPELLAAKARTNARLRAGLPDGDDRVLLAAWSIAHGFATLRRSGNRDRFLDGRDAEEQFREMLRIKP